MEAVATSRSDIVGDAGVTKSNAALTQSADGKTVSPLDFDPSLTEDERRFYTKAYPTVDVVRDRKVHCTVCKMHIGTAPAQESIIKMHPVLRVTHCTKCHDFYNSGEFSKGEDGSELYCRWCGQGGEVYCCSNCPYVFCKSCIVKNLSRGVVADIEQNENWSCFNCAPKILWPLRAQHWALINYIEKQKKVITDMNVTEAEMKKEMAKDRSNCCRLAKAKCGNMSDSMESIDSIASRRSQSSASSAKKSYVKPTSSQTPPAKRAKTSNDEVVCTPDLMSMLEPDCQITLSLKSRLPQAPQASSTPNPKPIGAQAGYGQHSTAPVSSAPPPLVLRNTGIQLRHPTPAPIVRRTVVGPRTPTPGSGATTPVYHTINGYRIDLNSAAQQETFRLPNGKLIQVKRQGTQHQVNVNPHQLGWQQRTAAPVQQPTRPIQITQTSSQPRYVTVSPAQQSHPQIVRYHNTMVGNTTVTPLGHNGAQSQIQVINGAAQAPTAVPAVRPPVMVRHVFPNTAIGQARTQLQDQVFNAMEICQHLTGKVQTLTNSNAYKQARNYLEVKELYIHLSYLLTYAIGRFKGLQDKCLGDMRQLGFVNDADSLENGQLAAGVDYVRYGQLDDVDLFNTGCNSFHNQVYEYRKSLHANLEVGEDGSKPPLSPLMPLGESNPNLLDDGTATEAGPNDDGWPQDDSQMDINNYDDAQDTMEELEDGFVDDEPQEEEDDNYVGRYGGPSSLAAQRGTEDYMRREEESHAYDRKLTRLIEQYPSIWCTRHPEYGNFEVTRKQWSTIASHFTRQEQANIKLRWKNIRKRFVRIERRIREGKRFNGYFDKATAFLTNRDLPMSEWISADKGEADGDVFERKQLDMVQRALHPVEVKRAKPETAWTEDYTPGPVKPIEIKQIDMKIINFVKCNPVLWRKSSDPACNKVDEQTRRSLWMHLWKSMPNMTCDDIIDRWMHLYEMYKTFRLKTIKDSNSLANLELKYSKYLAKLYFLYKIEEEELTNEYLESDDTIDEEDEAEAKTRLQDMPDDNEFVLELVCAIKQFPSLWNPRHVDYHDSYLRSNLWHEIEQKLGDFKRDTKSIKLRWQLAKFCYCRRRRELRNVAEASQLFKACKNLPMEEMSFLNAL